MLLRLHKLPFFLCNKTGKELLNFLILFGTYHSPLQTYFFIVPSPLPVLTLHYSRLWIDYLFYIQDNLAPLNPMNHPPSLNV